MNVSIAGENSLVLYFGDKICPELSAKVVQAVQRLSAALGDVIIDMVPSYASLLVIYDLFQIDYVDISQKIVELLADLNSAESTSGSFAFNGSFAEQRTVELPVYYSPESGPDLAQLALGAGLSIEDIIDIHQAVEYRVYAIGFAPGFAYLGEVDERIATPRLPSPRQHVPRGAVGIADRQTAIYPAASPGGWNLIGLCPQRMFNPDANPVMPVSVGDRVRFRSINRQQFLSLGGILV